MSTIRIAKRSRFTSIARPAINDSRLSYRARGILVWLLDKPDNWQVDSVAMSRMAKEGRDAVRTALKELEACGYLVRSAYRDPATGQWATEHTLHEAPQVASDAGTDSQSWAAPRNPVLADRGGSPDAGKLGAKTKTENENGKRGLSTPPSPSTGVEGLRLALDDARSVPPCFDDFWENFPRRNGTRDKKADAAAKWEKLSTDEKELAMHSLVNYADACERGLQRAADAITWLNGKRWETWTEPARADAKPGRPAPTDVVLEAMFKDPNMAHHFAPGGELAHHLEPGGALSHHYRHPVGDHADAITVKESSR